MTTLLLEKLKNKVESWKLEGYPGITSETRKILNHIYKVNYLYRPQKEAFETYIYLVLNDLVIHEYKLGIVRF